MAAVGDERTKGSRSVASIDDQRTVVDDSGAPPRAPGADDWDAALHRVDRYVMLHRLGEGAFGVVRAAYDPELDRKVAIKLMRREPSGRGGSTLHDPSTLIDEARMTAKLSHPNVVAIYDVGSLREAARGHPAEGASPYPGLAGPEGIYLVMEHLGGPSLADWLEDGEGGKRSWSEILEVFDHAGRGLAAAHARDMVHLDFKPQNLRFGDDGRIRVLDFGLARLNRQLGGQSDAVAGTPRFMSPEQHVGSALDARSDQYSFCVSLWATLYGRWPHEEEEFRRLAKAKFQRPDPPTDDAVPAWIGALLCRGLEPEPGDRFESMEALLEALRDDPAARRRRRVLTATVATALLAGGYGLATVAGPARSTADPCLLPPDHFAGIWDDDVRARVTASFERNALPYADAALHEVHEQLDAYLAGWSERRTQACRASLDRGEQTLDQVSHELQCLDRQLRRVAAASSSFMHADDAVILHAAELLAELPPPSGCQRSVTDDEERARAEVSTEASLRLEERVAQAENLARVGDLAKSSALSDEIIAEAERRGDDGARTRALLVKALAAVKDSRFDEATQAALSGHALAMQRGDIESAARALVALVSIHRVNGDFEKAQLVADVAEGVVAQAGPGPRVDFAFQLGALAEDRNHWDEALERLASARALAEQLYGEDHLQVGDIVIVQGIANSASGRDFDAALAHFEHAREIFRARYGELHPRVASTYNNIGGVYFRRGRFDESIPHFERSLEIYTEVSGEEHELTMRAVANLAVAEYQRGNTDRGIELTGRALALRRTLLGEDNPHTISSAANYAMMLVNDGRPREGLPLLVQVHARTEQMHGATDPQTIGTAGAVGTVAASLGERAQAVAYFERVLRGLEATAEDEPRRAEVWRHAIHAALHAEDHALALRLAQARSDLFREEHGANSLAVALADVQVGEALLELSRVDEAHARLSSAWAVIDAEDDGRTRRGTDVRMALARAETERGQPSVAREHYTWVVDRLTAIERSPDILARAHLELARLAEDDAARRRHATACIGLLEPSGLLPPMLEQARALLAGG